MDRNNSYNSVNGNGMDKDSIPNYELHYLGTDSLISTIINALYARRAGYEDLLIESEATLPVNPTVCRQAMAEHLRRVNDRLKIGRFNFNFDDAGFGSIKYCYSIVLNNKEYVDSVKMKILMISILVVNIYGDDIFNLCRAALPRSK